MEEYKGFKIWYDSPSSAQNVTVDLSQYGMKDIVFGQLRLARIFIDGIETGFQIKAMKK